MHIIFLSYERFCWLFFAPPCCWPHFFLPAATDHHTITHNREGHSIGVFNDFSLIASASFLTSSPLIVDVSYISTSCRIPQTVRFDQKTCLHKCPRTVIVRRCRLDQIISIGKFSCKLFSKDFSLERFLEMWNLSKKYLLWKKVLPLKSVVHTSCLY